MSIDSLKSLLNDFDPTTLLPSLDKVLGHLAPLVRLAVLAGPICLLVFGLIFLFLPPKEANHSLGFRCFRGMASVEAWKFTQFVAGITWTALGVVLGLWMLVAYRGAGEMDRMELVLRAIRSILWEIGLSVAGAIGIRITVAVFFDLKGNRRKPKTGAAKPKRTVKR